MPRTPKQAAILSEPLHRSLNSYALAATAAGVGALALAAPAEAKIVYTRANVPVGDHNHHYRLDLNHDGVKDFSFAYPGSSSGPHSAALVVQSLVKRNGIVARTDGTSREFRYPAALPAGVSVGAPQAFRSGKNQPMAGWRTGSSTSYRGNWINQQNRYLGVKFLIKGKLHYGWARLSVSVRAGLITGTLTGYAYETISNKPIITGKTKGRDVITVQPRSVGHLAAGRR